MTTILTLSKEQRDNLRGYISTQACTSAVEAFPTWDPVPEDREMVLAQVDRARGWLELLDRIGWEIESAEDASTILLEPSHVELLLSLEDEIRETYDYDHRADDRAALEAVVSLKAAVA